MPKVGQVLCGSLARPCPPLPTAPSPLLPKAWTIPNPRGDVTTDSRPLRAACALCSHPPCSLWVPQELSSPGYFSWWQVSWRVVSWGLGLQFVLGFLVIRTEPGFIAFQWLGDQIQVCEWCPASQAILGCQGMEKPLYWGRVGSEATHVKELGPGWRVRTGP